MYKRAFWIIGFIATMLTLSACNTIEGAGEDIQQGGEEIEDAAD